ncbi:MAG: phosphate ABC transporter permease PstA, partial [Alphaproteobacteria bacterium]|nr:phosphate ABC transporter permease PstA [Alphaproteobacteria bacterium]
DPVKKYDAYQEMIAVSLSQKFTDKLSSEDKTALINLVSLGTLKTIHAMTSENPSLWGNRRELWVPVSNALSDYLKGKKNGKLTEKQKEWVQDFQSHHDLRTSFRTSFFTNSDSQEPELAGILGAVFGSIFTLMIALAIAFPIGTITAVYLEEFAPRSWWADLIEISLNNLAAVPSIVFGLLALSVFLLLFGLPRSASLVGGLTLALMMFPLMIIASREALKAVPKALREAAQGLGASRIQVVFHHVLPSAIPGIITGTIISIARAIGESAPLLLIGMVAFIPTVPESLMSPATVLPVQIYQWVEQPESGFIENSSAAILVLLLFLFILNFIAIYIRKHFEKQW